MKRIFIDLEMNPISSMLGSAKKPIGTSLGDLLGGLSLQMA